ncbi:hypothetical protein MIND_01271000 [Mycena indigotica]|uniref:Heme haloperoxidase family profile domain-containing protein n=1 Tax=Mycena indigotica TaxID=2126181 RepID=A0A8H6VRF0_9AGAR|nr:uncharacterized protein MIND_01271000 [Mycena indigotica]KAF7291272.1 hypothetical protein MIND_01271000 [Mycena indigotica]
MAGPLFYAYIALWDAYLTLANLLTPQRKPGAVVPAGHPGARGVWPEYVPPKEGDSRCCCPALNAMANHGILPHDGRRISFAEMGAKIAAAYNFGGTFCRFVPQYAADMLHKDFHKDTFDLAELNLHNGIEHDASLTRRDAHFDAAQDAPHLPYVDALLSAASGPGGALTLEDLARVSAGRRTESRRDNPAFSLAKVHKGFSGANSTTLLSIFGGRVADLAAMLKEERIPPGWEPAVRARKGLTFITFNRTVARLEKATGRFEQELALASAAGAGGVGAAGNGSREGLVD